MLVLLVYDTGVVHSIGPSQGSTVVVDSQERLELGTLSSKFSTSKWHSFRDYQDAWTAVTDLKLSRAGGGWERMQHTSMFVNKPQLGVG